MSLNEPKPEAWSYDYTWLSWSLSHIIQQRNKLREENIFWQHRGRTQGRPWNSIRMQPQFCHRRLKDILSARYNKKATAHCDHTVSVLDRQNSHYGCTEMFKSQVTGWLSILFRLTDTDFCFEVTETGWHDIKCSDVKLYQYSRSFEQLYHFL